MQDGVDIRIEGGEDSKRASERTGHPGGSNAQDSGMRAYTVSQLLLMARIGPRRSNRRTTQRAEVQEAIRVGKKGSWNRSAQ